MKRLVGIVVALLGFMSPCWGQFSTVYNVPPDTPPRFIDSDDTQVNLFEGGSLGVGIALGSNLGTSANIEMNMYGGTLPRFNSFPGTTFNMFGGTTTSTFFSFSSKINIHDGMVGDGNFSDTFIIHFGTANIYGGRIRADMFVEEAVLNLYGGSLEGRFTGYQRAQVNLFVKSFFIKGEQVTDLLPGVRKDYGLLGRQMSGTLGDGSPFDVLNAEGHTSVTLVPEPSCMLLTAFALLGLRRGRR